MEVARYGEKKFLSKSMMVPNLKNELCQHNFENA